MRIDTERIDFLAQHVASVHFEPRDRWVCKWHGARFQASTWREAVDAAMDADEAYRAADQDTQDAAHHHAVLEDGQQPGGESI